MSETSNALIEYTAWLSQNAVNLLLQSTALILVGLTVARLLSKYGSAVQSAIYRATLVAVLVCPVIALTLNHFGMAGWTLHLPATATTIQYEVRLPQPVDDFADRSDQPDQAESDNGFGLPLATDNASKADQSPQEVTESSDQQTEFQTESSANAMAATTIDLARPMLSAERSKTIERRVNNSASIAIYFFMGSIWMIVSMVLLIRIGLAYRRIQRLRTESFTANPNVVKICNEVAKRIRVSTPEVRRNPLLCSPCLTGIASPTILLPTELNGTVPLEKAFAHELAHLRRHDTFWNLMQRVVLALFFYQPLMWRLIYRLETSAEEVCDDYVVRHCMDRAGYAQQLVDLAESNLLAPNMAGLGMFNSKSLLGHRVVRILDGTRKLTTNISQTVVLAIMATTVMCATLGGFLGNGSNPLAVVMESSDAQRADAKKSNAAGEKSFSWQLIDIDGQPISDATIRITEVSEIDQDVEHKLDESHRAVVQSDSDGRFVLVRSEKIRTARAFISSPHTATRSAHLIAATDQEYEKFGYGPWQSDDNNFMAGEKIICAPGMEVSGVIRDANTRKPIAGATIKCGRVVNEHIQAVSDAKGQYRVSGLPITNRLPIRVEPAADQPWLIRDFMIPVSTNATHNIDIKMHRGIWIEGHVTDLDTGQPVKDAIVYHFPLTDNPHLGDYPEYDGKFRGPLFNKQYFTDEKGHYRMVGIPGPAVMGVRAGGALGMDSDKPAAKRQLAMMPGAKLDDTLTRIVDVNFKRDSLDHRQDFQVTQGKSVELQTVDPSGKPISGVYVTRGNIPGTNWLGLGVQVEESRFAALNFVPGKKRILKFVSPDKRLGVVQEIGLDNETAQTDSNDPVTVQLQPFATVKFRLIDDKGDPVAGVTQFEFDSYQQSLNPRTTRVDSNGKMMFGNEGNNGQYIYDQIVSGTNYVIRFQPADSSFPVFLHSALAIAPGEVIDLGTIDISKKDRPELTRTRLRSQINDVKTQAEIQETKPQTAASKDGIKFSGIVVDLAGKPVAGVDIKHREFTTKSNEDGSFSIEIPKEAYQRFPGARLVVSGNKEGYGSSTASLDLKNPHSLRLTLADDHYPIIGKLIDQQGIPVAGAEVKVQQVHVFPNVDLNQLLAIAETNPEVLNRLPRGVGMMSDQILPVTTDANGDFTIHRIGSGRLALLVVTGQTIAHQRAAVATADIEQVNSEKLPYPYNSKIVHGHRITLVCEPSQPVEGKIIDRETQKPLAGIQVNGVVIRKKPGEIFNDRLFDVAAVTDASGRFRLTGLPTASEKQIAVTPSLNGETALPYLPESFDVAHGTGVDTIEMTAGLQRGVWIRGTVTDADSGKPLPRVTLSYHPYPENQAMASMDQMRQAELSRRQIPTDENGKFQLVGLPGPALLRLQNHYSGNYPAKQGWSDIPDQRKGADGIETLPFKISGGTAVKEINATDQGARVDFALSLGQTVHFKTVDPDGNPITGVHVLFGNKSGDPRPQEAAEFGVRGFVPGAKRMIMFSHPEKQLGRKQSVSSNAGETVVVKLQPNATMTAKLVDDQGQPAQVPLRIDMIQDDKILFQALPTDKADENGVFKHSLVPGQYLVSISSFSGFSGYKKIDVRPGDQLDLGTIDVTKKLAVHMMSSPMPGMSFIKDIPAITVDSEEDGKTPRGEKKKNNDSANKDLSINGSVHDPTGRFVVDSEVGVYLYWRIEGGRKTIYEAAGKARTDRQGNYEMVISKEAFNRLESSISHPSGGYTAHHDAIARGFVISAQANGFGPAWHRFEDETPSTKLDFKLAKSTVPIRGQVVNLEGKPIAGVSVRPVTLDNLGSLFDWEIGQPVTTNRDGRFEFKHVGDARKVTLELNGGGIARTWIESQTKHLEPYLVDPNKRFYGVTSGYGSQPVISVERGQSLIGQITDGKTGKPLVGVTVTTEGLEKRQIVQTDSDGKYRIDGLVPRNEDSQPLYLTIKSPNPKHFVTTIGRRDKPADRSSPIEQNVELHSGKIIHGQLIDATTGKGVAGTVMYYPKMDNEEAARFVNFDAAIRTLRPKNRAITNAKGEFSITVIPGQGLLAARTIDRDSFASAHGSGGIDREEDTRQFFHLPRIEGFNQFHLITVTEDDNPTALIKIRRIQEALNEENDIRGTVVDLEGRPVIGAKVHVSSARFLGNDLAERWLETLQEKKDHSTANKLIVEAKYVTAKELNRIATTNQKGNFDIKGLPASALLTLRIEHPQIVTHLVQLLNRPLKVVDAGGFKVHGNELQVVAHPCRPITGKVVDFETGQPIAGAIVYCDELGIPDTVYGSGAAPRTETNSEGKFELLGVPKTDATRLVVYPPIDKIPYLIQDVYGVPDTVGLEPAKLKIRLHRGIWISGQVTDKQTGEGVDSEILYLPLRDNPNLKGLFGYQLGPYVDRYLFFDNYKTDNEGHFRIAGLPGRAILGARSHSQDFRSAAGYNRVLEQFGRGYSQQKIELARQAGVDLTKRKILDTRLSYSYQQPYGGSFIAIEPGVNDAEFKQDIQLDPGKDVSIKVVDENGRPVERFIVSRYDGFFGRKEFTAGEAVLNRMGDDETRSLWITSQQRSLGAVVDVSGVTSNRSDKTIVLRPFGKVRGRLINNQGKPLVDYRVDPNSGKEAVTDTNGEFEVTQSIAGRIIQLEIYGPKPNKFNEFKNYSPKKTIEAGQTLELGDINLDAIKLVMISGLAG